jgi:ribonuclease VapC
VIVIDSSALIALVLDEAEWTAILQDIERAERVLISTPTVLEARLVVQYRRGQRAVVLSDDLLQLPLFEWVAAGDEETQVAYAAFVAFGEGSGHPAGLNCGDLFSYALAKVRGVPLLYTGDDFGRTDLVSALGNGA